MTPEQLADLKDRLRRGAQACRSLASQRAGIDIPEVARLRGKVQGLDVALGYIEEYERS